MFAQKMAAGQIAGLLRVSTKSVYQWRRAWRVGGEAALASKGPSGNACKLDEDQLARLRAALDAGPAVYGWEQDQRWTLARVLGPEGSGWRTERRPRPDRAGASQTWIFITGTVEAVERATAPEEQ